MRKLSLSSFKPFPQEFSTKVEFSDRCNYTVQSGWNRGRDVKECGPEIISPVRL
jgi:hypothetical protein